MPKALRCAAELLTMDLSGKKYVVTGGNSGIGLATVRQLARQGAHVVIASRRPQQGERAAEAIRSETPKGTVSVLELDLGSLKSVRSFAAAYLARHSRLDGLINNAGVMNTPQGKTVDGFETQFGTNHLGHFLLTELLLPVLKESAPSRVIILSSCYHDMAMGREGRIDFDDLHFERKKYDGWAAYAQSKLANVLYARHLGKRVSSSGVTVVSVHPGWVRTNLIRSSMPVWLQDYLLLPLLRLGGMLEPWEGAQTTLHTLLSPEASAHPGAYFSQVGFYRVKEAKKGGWPLHSPNPLAHSDKAAERLDEISRMLVGIR